MLSAEVSEIRSVFDKSVTYEIPDYQRPFAWKVAQAEEFWDDVSQGATFLGTFVFNIELQEKQRRISVVDGQQRLTVLCIFLSACSHQLRRINENRTADITLSKLSYVDDTTGKGTGAKILVSDSIRDAFEKTIVDPEWDGETFEIPNRKLQIRKIKPIYEYFRKKLSGFSADEMANVLGNAYSSTVVQIEIDDIQDAFDIFERTNARGVDLNTADLLKNYLFSNVGSMESTTQKQLLKTWDEIVENANGNVQRLLKYFYVSRRGPTTRRVLFRNIKMYGEGRAEELLCEMHDFAQLYNLVLNSTKDGVLYWAEQNSVDYFRNEYAADSLNRHYEALCLFGVTPSHPFIIKMKSTLVSIEKSKQEKACKAFLKLLNAVERFHFANYAICQRPGNEIEKFYADHSKTEVDQSNYGQFISTICTEIKQRIVGKEEFNEAFVGLNYSSNFELIYYINDRLNNVSSKGGQYIQIYNTDPKLLKRNYNTEHLFAQDDGEYDLDFSTCEDLVQNIGNLIIISMHTNGEIGNKTLDEKLPIIESKEKLAEAVILCNEWRDASFETLDEVQLLIEVRAKNLSKRAYAFASKF